MSIFGYSASKTGRAGFTLIEMIITLAVLGLLISAVGVSAPINRESFLLTTSQEQLRDLITRAKALSVNSVFSSVPGGESCGYGVHIDSVASTAFIFRGCGADPTFFSVYAAANATSTELTGSLNQMAFDRSLKLSFSQAGSYSNGSAADIFFLPPDPLVYINGANQAGVAEAITISPVNNTSKIIWGVNVNSVGLIEPVH
ncbi:MAG TPA: type II secretion system protein [Candidatus Tyrphobacter sp.]|nr:type II secretion system protein [Candidatus Tyrphobacter sp.]